MKPSPKDWAASHEEPIVDTVNRQKGWIAADLLGLLRLVPRAFLALFRLVKSPK